MTTNTMKRLTASLLLGAACLLCTGAASAADEMPGVHILKLKKNSAVIQFDGREIQAAQPVTIKDASAYLPLRGIAEPFGFALSYDSKTKEAVAKSAKTELRFKNGSASIKVNGKQVKGPGPVFVQQGSMMVPVRLWAELTGSRITAAGGEIVIRWSSAPVAAFEVGPETIYAGQTTVVYTDRASHPDGIRIVEEKWEGRLDQFPSAGRYTITRRVRDANGAWSDPYAVTVQVRPPNEAPIADYKTDKTTYRIGEQVAYTDLSIDDEQAIVRRTWLGREDAYFEAGERQVTLEVEDKHGLTHHVTKTITITDEVLYEKTAYDRLFTPVGGKFPVISTAVLKEYELIPYTMTNEPSQMVLSNSPETFIQTGIAYDAVLTGKTSFIFYHVSKLPYPVRLYLIATNNGSEAVEVATGATGAAGPATESMLVGKLSTIRYTDSIQRNEPPVYTTIQPNESKVLIEEHLSKLPLKPGQTISAYADLDSSDAVRYRIAVVPVDEDPLQQLDELPLMPRDGLHVRGTFLSGDRMIAPAGELGRTKQRIVLGDQTSDYYAAGVDVTAGTPEYNQGNYGIWYRLKLNVAPGTLVTLNGRGGHYAGAVLVNGRMVELTKGSMLKDKNETGVLYRTGARAETIEIAFVPANGSNMPVALLFEPLPPLQR